MYEKRMKEEQKRPEGESVPAGESLEDQALEEAAGGAPWMTPWAEKKQLPTQ